MVTGDGIPLCSMNYFGVLTWPVPVVGHCLERGQVFVVKVNRLLDNVSPPVYDSSVIYYDFQRFIIS